MNAHAQYLRFGRQFKKHVALEKSSTTFGQRSRKSVRMTWPSSTRRKLQRLLTRRPLTGFGTDAQKRFVPPRSSKSSVHSDGWRGSQVRVRPEHRSDRRRVVDSGGSRRTIALNENDALARKSWKRSSLEPQAKRRSGSSGCPDRLPSSRTAMGQFVTQLARLNRTDEPALANWAAMGSWIA